MKVLPELLFLFCLNFMRFNFKVVLGASCRCGETFIDPRIIGGHQAKELRYSWVVAVISKSGDLICSASLITSSWIITTAHCFDDMNNRDIFVNVGSNEWIKASQIRNIRKIIPHEAYNGFPTHHNDLALAKLDSPVILNDTLHVICLPRSSESDRSAYYTTVGWGRTEEGYPTTLQEVDITHRPEDHCSKWWGKEEHFDSNIQICAGMGEGSCAGDFGGPLMTRRFGRYVLAGITAYGYEPCGTSLYPGVYTRLTWFIDWIKRGLGEDGKELCFEGSSN